MFSLLSLPSASSVLHLHLTSLDTRELRPGPTRRTILGPSGPGSDSTRPTDSYPFYLCFKSFVVLHQRRFPRLVLEFSHALCLQVETVQTKGPEFVMLPVVWQLFPSSFLCRSFICDSTSTDSVRSVCKRRAARRIQPSYRSSSSGSVGSGGRWVVSRDDHLHPCRGTT